jgi:short subunit dehydrogenase-like uncharacterized protein
MAERPYDIVLFGATGFTGGLTAEYLAGKMATERFRLALAGRNLGKLEAVRQRAIAIDPAAAAVGLIEASVDDRASLQRMAAQARLVITTVGPYILFGEPVVEACVAEGADYLDLTGEPEFVDLMIERYGDQARRRGVRIVNACGFDSIPHDLGAFFTVRRLNERLGEKAGQVPVAMHGYLRGTGNFSGGTLHSAVLAMSRARQYAEVRRRKPKPPQSGRKARVAVKVLGRHKDLGGWSVTMPTIDPAMVVRSARAYDFYGPDFRYGHNLIAKRLTSLVALGAGAAGMFALAQVKPTRDWLLKIKEPGQGPSPEQRAKGRFTVTFEAQAGATHIVTAVNGRDPGYGETAKMLSEMALCLTLDQDLPPYRGVITPAMAAGDALIERLQRAGIRFEVKS